MPPLIRVGAPRELEVEAEPKQPVDPEWVHGRFCLWASGTAIGDQRDVVTLKAVVAWWRDFVVDEQPRWDNQLAGLGAQAAIDLLHASAFGGHRSQPVPDAFRFFIGHLGMSAFDAYDVVLVDDPQGTQRLLWRHRDSPVKEAVFAPRSLQRIGREFLLAWTDAGLPR